VRGAGRRHDGNKPAQILGEFFRAVTQKISSTLSPGDAHGQVATLIRAFRASAITTLIILFINSFARAFDPTSIRQAWQLGEIILVMQRPPL
jgi:hypothetical protein